MHLFPDGRNLTVADIPAGDSRLGYADAESRPEVILQGETLDRVFCEPRLPSGIEVHREIDSHDQLVARVRLGQVPDQEEGIHGHRDQRRLHAHGPHQRLRGLRRHYPLSYGIADPGVVLTGPGGPWATANRPPSAADHQRDRVRQVRHAAVAELPRRGLERHGGALLAGIMTCKKT